MPERSELLERLCAASPRAAGRVLSALAAVLVLFGGASGQQSGQGEGRRQTTTPGGFTYTLKRGAAGGEGSAFEGKVVDPAGAVIAGADVLVYSRATKKPYVRVTSDEGLFAVRGLPPGAFDVEIYSPGFKRFKMKKLNVGGGESVEIELVLPVAPEPMLTNPAAVRALLPY